MTWRIESTGEQVGGPLALFAVIACHEAWRRLTPIQRYYVSTSTEDGQCDPMHGKTRKALVAHGICDESGRLTPPGMDVKRFRPKPKETT